MYCSTCGARIPHGRTSCDTCGASAGHRLVEFVTPGLEASGPTAFAGPAAVAVPACPRCGYRGEGLSYFARGSHVAALVGITVLTSGIMGAGGLIYYLQRRDHQLCPRCGRGWGRSGERALVPRSAMSTATGDGFGPPRVRRDSNAAAGWSILLFVVATILMVVGIAEFAAIPLLLGMAAGGGGLLLHRSANRAREERRAALIASLQLPVLQLAARRGGKLTVTEVSAELGWPLPRSEKVLQSLDDGVRVDSEVTDEGVIVYHFRELLPPGPE